VRATRDEGVAAPAKPATNGAPRGNMPLTALSTCSSPVRVAHLNQVRSAALLSSPISISQLAAVSWSRFTGPSGAQTTLLRLHGQLVPTRGEVWGRRARSASVVARGLGRFAVTSPSIYQEQRLAAALNALENLVFRR